MPTVSAEYQGQLRTESTHANSGTALQTDAPPDNNGLGRSFSPTDLVATALGSCMVTIMGIRAQQNGFELGKVAWQTQKVMTGPPRRITRLQIDFRFEDTYTPEQQKILEEEARHCPVALSIHPDIEQGVRFHFAS